MFKDLSIKNKLYMGFGSIVAIILILLGVAYNSFTRLSEANGWDRHTMEVLIEIDKIHNSILQIQVETRGYLLSGNEVSLNPETDEMAVLTQHTQKAIAMTVDNKPQSERFRKIDQLASTWVKEWINPLIDKRRALGNTPGAADTVARMIPPGGSPGILQANKMLDDATAEENRLLAERSARSASLQETMLLTLSLGGLLCIVLALAIAYILAKAILNPLNNLTDAVGRIAGGEQGARAAIISGDELGKVTTEFNRMAQTIQDNQANELAATNTLRAKVDSLLEVVSKAASGDLTGKVTITGSDAIGQLGNGLAKMFENLRSLLNNVQKAGIQVTTSATEIAASARQQEATGIEQAQTSVEILSTTKEISANTSQLLKTMEDATAVADYTTNATAEAQNNLKRMDSTMQHMVSATDSINAKLAALSEKASNINSVLITITKVADQTNILSLNAAIEAEKAGEAGRGFSVVATEIRRLADQTSVSTWDIEQMLKEMQSAVSASVMGMDKFSEEIRRSVGEVRQVAEQLSSVMDQVQKLTPQFDAVLQGMQSQAVGASQISDTMMQLNDATQQTVESLKATSEAVHQLQYAAGDLQSSVSNFAVTI
ncbi:MULTISPECIES: methyl-accepting chemotaxis protein [unclassified Janthinobacterium]|uniref:methyl-accepting chemotaxis protein n=1 Tax=unclassified Janthinobacterium TaxID=2610881 RepID=UPI00160D5C54|nr:MULTISPECIES: methyl-accepting chemotaxis protein [unclassified Janthinobacterium]MBB5369437.1 methyl-accepting chemotaxis protein WspA [Janthinobacterium sp. K2C7]MBB5381027.1 methyl-accepting chemotaxis protein WspA [Janthinobacterium sp. K2Li3]MBB5387820.1 methyl-accepting chemotaxis protein WspA [Janthinobacterium sp. K2E3]